MRADRSFLAARFRQRFTARIKDDAAPGVWQMRISAATIDARDISLIFNRSRFEERRPVLLSRRWPTGDDRQEIGSAPHRCAKDFRKAQVVTDEGRNREALPGKEAEAAA